MRILHLSHKPQRRGAEVFAWQLARSHRNMGHCVGIRYLYPYPQAPSLALGADDLLLGGDESSYLERGLGVHPLLLARLVSSIKQFRPDIVQVNGGRTVKYGAFAKRIITSPTWALVYQNIDDPVYWLRGSARYRLYRHLVMPKVDGVVGVSEATLANVRKVYGLRVPSQVMLNARHPADLAFTAQEYEAAHELRRQPQAPLLIFAGSLRPQKRPDRFLRVVKLVHERFGIVEAWMLGDGPEREQVRRMAKELAIADHVHMLGYQEHVAPYLAQADLLLLTSDSEGTPGVVIEAAMLGKPSVATNTGGTTGCILDRETGILAPPEDEALAAAVLELLRDPDTRLRYGRRAKSWVGEHFTMDRVARRYLNFYEELTQGRRK